MIGWEQDSLDDQEMRHLVYQQQVDQPHRLVRYLRARRGDLDKAEALLRKDFQFRCILGMETLVDTYEPPLSMMQYAATPLINESLRLSSIQATKYRLEHFWLRDKAGHCSIFVRAGKLYLRGMYKKMHGMRLLELATWAIELARRDFDYLHEQSGGKASSKVTVVFDLHGFNLGDQIPVQHAVSLIKLYMGVLVKVKWGLSVFILDLLLYPGISNVFTSSNHTSSNYPHLLDI